MAIVALSLPSVVARAFHPSTSLGVALSSVEGQASDPGRGKQLFQTYFCYSCHGTEGQGGAGPRIVTRATADPLIRYVRKPTGTMPAYTSKVISEQELRDIYAYLRAIPASPAAKDIPILNK